MNPTERRSFLAWPGWAHLRFAWLQTALVSAWFALVFIGANEFTAHRAARWRVHLDAELRLPLIPAFLVIYMSIYVLFLAAPFVLRTRREISAMAIAQSLAILLAGICFLLIPTQLAYAPPENLGVWQGLFRFADGLNLDYNLVPSLHVALSVACIEMFAARASFIGKCFLRGWGLLIAASTLLTHQHHLLDAATGWLLAFAALWLAQRIEKLFSPSELSTPSARYST